MVEPVRLKWPLTETYVKLAATEECSWPNSLQENSGVQNQPNNWHALEQLFLGIFLTLLLVFIALNLHWIANLARDYGWLPVVILTLVFGYILYSIRYLWPLAYGFAEILIGAWLLYAATIGAPQGAADELTYWTLVGKFAAAVYIIIRGFDNISQSRFVVGSGWAWIFECRWVRWARWDATRRSS